MKKENERNGKKSTAKPKPMKKKKKKRKGEKGEENKKVRHAVVEHIRFYCAQCIPVALMPRFNELSSQLVIDIASV